MTRLRRAGLVAAVAGVIALSAAAVALTRPDFVLLVGDDVVGGRVVAFTAWGAGAVLAAVLVGAVVLPRRAALRGPFGLASLGLLGAAVVCSGVWTVGAGLAAAGAGTLNGASWTVLRPPPGVRACDLVASEGSFIVSSGGEVYLVDGWGVGLPLTTWRGDDAQRPFERSGTGVIWHPGGGTLRLDGGDRAISPARVDFTCPG